MTTERTPNIGALGVQRRRGLFAIAAGGGSRPLSGMYARGTAVPIGRTTQASVLGVPNERFFPRRNRTTRS